MEAFENFKERYFISGIQVGLVNELEIIKGVAETTAIAFMTGLDCFETFCDEMGLEIKEVKKVESTVDFSGRVFVFSGVRDNDLKEFIIDNGGDVKGSVSKNTTDMLVKDANSTTAKVTKARDLGCTIHNIEDFKTSI
jgi:NAD-dependent DNA ligase